MAIGLRDRGVDDQPIAVLHQRMTHERNSLAVFAFAKQPAVWVSAGFVRLVAARLAAEFAAIVVVVLAVFAHEALVARPGFESGSVHAEVLLGQPLLLVCLPSTALKKATTASCSMSLWRFLVNTVAP